MYEEIYQSAQESRQVNISAEHLCRLFLTSFLLHMFTIKVSVAWEPSKVLTVKLEYSTRIFLTKYDVST